MYNTKLILAYKGTNYCGFQIQAKGGDPTIQSYLNEALYTIFGEKLTTHMCSRTDSGVHANGQVVNFRHLKDRIPEPSKLLIALNSNLPQDIRVISVEKAHENFHSRYSAKGKLYSYTIDNFIAHRPLTADTTCHVRHPLDVEKMSIAAKYFIGTHDFYSFKGSGGTTKTSTRTINSLELLEKDSYIQILTSGNGFLYNMVRIMAGTLIEVGKGKIEPEEIIKIMEARDRKKAGPTAPAQGLVLEKIYY